MARNVEQEAVKKERVRFNRKDLAFNWKVSDRKRYGYEIFINILLQILPQDRLTNLNTCDSFYFLNPV